MSKQVQILSRAYKASDQAACLAIFRSNIGLYFGAEEIQDYQEFLLNQVEDNHYLVLYLAQDPAAILACGGFGELEEKIFLRWGMVDQAAHKQGLGLQLLAHRLAAVNSALGQREVYIDTSQQVQGFYEKYGFKAISVIKDGFAPQIDKVRMQFSDWDQAFIQSV
ncbi:GNAT family N-acetyltransferase [Kangiella sp. TOML190]|uniref:GNAT family N-acetyltransferase n=1 Tax=Kangiella sp. TOML190 TaxID=2931351 RepID=UPI00203F8ADE|nr:GNAT family N-acetyltransferase [Kangiella sp. TOML190]